MMDARYVGYGLALRCSFPLPGMSRTHDGSALPSLALELLGPAELTEAWSGVDGEPLWRGRLGDGSDLTLERGLAGDLLFSDGIRARFLLHPDGASLACAPEHAGLDWQRTLLTKVLSCVALLRGYEALHASALGTPWGTLAIAAPSGMGKSTLALELIRRGCRLLADDVLVLSPAPAGVLAHPATPHMNLAANPSWCSSPDDVGRTLGVLGRERWVAAHATARDPSPLRAVFMLERAPGLSLDVAPLTPSPLPLAPYMLSLPADAERARARFELYAGLAGTAALMRITAPEMAHPQDIVDLMEEAPLGRPAIVAAGASA